MSAAALALAAAALAAKQPPWTASPAAHHRQVVRLLLGRQPCACGRGGLPRAGAGAAAARRASSSSSVTAAAAAGSAATAAAANAGGAAAGAGRQRSAVRRLRAALRDYKALSKFRLSALVALTASAGFAAGSGEAIDYAKLAWTSLGTLGAAACANTLNQVYEVANDARMARTANRPLPAGRVGVAHALAFAALTGAAGLWVLAEQTNALTTGLGAANILLYAGCYTPLKQLSVANTWVGAVVGAIPPLMGWAAAAGELEPGAWVLAAALFSWQMPHFLALAWLCKDDYVRGGFRMLPSIDPSGRRTAAVALRHAAFLMPLGAVAVALQVASPWFAGEAALLAAAMVGGALAFRANPTPAGARKLFRGSLLYLPLLLAALAAHRQPNAHALGWPEARAAAAARLGALDELLPEPLRPGALWAALGKLHAPRMRPLEERWAMLIEVQAQIQAMRCPSRAYAEGEAGAGGAGGRREQQQRQQQQVQEQQHEEAGS